MYLGIDLGTSGIKALLIDDNQNIIASAKSQLQVQRKEFGWSEQNPQDWIKALKNVFLKLKNNYAKELKSVRGIGLSGQMHGATLLGEKDEVLRACILWNDTRSHKEAKILDEDPKFRKITGNIVFPGFTAPKLLWLKNNEPEIFKKVKKVLLPKDYLRLWLTGEYVSEMSDSSGTSWLDTKNRVWSKDLLEATFMKIEQMPRLIEGTDVSGKLKNEIAQSFGMSNDVVVAGGASDNAATAIGAGTISNGSSFVSLGTSGVLFNAVETYIPNPQSAVHTFCHALANKWHQMGVILSATASLEWFSNICGVASKDLSASLGESLKEPSSEIFLPYLSGERTPYNDANIRGVFMGLNNYSDKVSITQAIMEGVTFALRDNLEALKVTGADLNSLVILGGGSSSIYWQKLISTVLNLAVNIPKEGDFGAAFGAARLALIASTNANPYEICKPPIIASTVYPEKKFQESFEEAYEKYKKLYPAISNI